MEADPGGAYASSSRGIQLPPKRASTTNHHVFPEFSPSKSKKMTPFSVCSIHHVTPWKQVILNPSGQGCQYGTAHSPLWPGRMAEDHSAGSQKTNYQSPGEPGRCAKLGKRTRGAGEPKSKRQQASRINNWWVGTPFLPFSPTF